MSFLANLFSGTPNSSLTTPFDAALRPTSKVAPAPAPTPAPAPSTQAEGQAVLDAGGVKSAPGTNIAANNPASQGGTLLGGYFDKVLP